MSNSDDTSGRLKEAAGDLTNNDDLKRKGKSSRPSELPRRNSTRPPRR
jgi:hypothetical protein